ncbi:MAG: M48 family metalloprotease, partial [Planctomycetota bacterium JB042]
MFLVGGCFVLAFVVCLVAARRHAIQTGASRTEALPAVVALAAASTGPVAAAVALTAAGADGGGTLGRSVALVLFPLALLFAARYLRPPVAFPGSGESLPLVDDQTFLDRIAELSGRLGLAAPPLVRLLRSTQANLSALAFAGGLFRPTLVVTDGIVHRLDPDERDAIVAHELAHVSTRSLWVLALAATLGWAVAVPFLAGLPFLVGLLVACNVQAVLHRLAQRRYEIACDLAAARAVGAAVVARALGKIHRVHVLPERGFLPLVLHATATHPHQAVRAAALAAADAGEGDPDARRGAAARARPHRIAAVVLFAVWGAAIVSAIRFGARPELYAPILLGLLLLFAQFPLLLLALVFSKWRRQRRRVGFELPADRWMRRAVVAGALGYALFLVPDPGRLVGVALVLAAAVVILVAALRRRKGARLRRRIGPPLSRHAWTEAIAVAEAEPELLARDPALRHDVALCRALSGDRAGAIRDLERIEERWPTVRVASIALALLRLFDDPEAALRHADALAEGLPEDPIGPDLRGRALVRLLRIDEAAAAAEEALAREPDDATARTILCSVHLARGATDAAAEACREAFEREPGAAEVRLARARLAVAAESREQARRRVAEALEAAEA